MKRKIIFLGLALVLANVFCAGGADSDSAKRRGKKPNILIIWGDDIGWFNPSCYHGGVMGYQTPNIDRIAKEGARFTDWYGQQSCTAGRAAFIMGQSPIRTGLTKVGLPGSPLGIQPQDPTIAELLKPMGYACGQFGKNHLGDRNEFLPTVHGFDEFFGNLYHLNAEEEPENPDYPKGPEFKKKFGPRGVLHSWATDSEDSTEDPQFGRVGKQKIENTGPLDTKRMETVDEEFLEGALKFIDKSHQQGKPFFCWFNSTRMHVFTHLKKESKGKTGLGTYPDGMVEHDGHVGELLKKLDDLGIADNTIVMWSTDNGAETMTWPDGGTTPFRSEKDTDWEGGWRVPCVIRWPGVIKPGTVSSEICAHEDMMPTLLAAAGDPNIVEECLQGHKAGDRNYRVHLDGYNLVPVFKGEAKESPRKEMMYWSDDGDLMALRYGRWKIHFLEQRAHGMNVWSEPFVKLRFPMLIDLRSDPFEKAPEDSINYSDWAAHRMFAMVPAQAFVSKWIASFKEFPPRQKPASFNLDEVMTKLQSSGEGPLTPTGSSTGKPGEPERAQPESKAPGSANPLGGQEWKLTELNGERIEQPQGAGAEPPSLKFDSEKKAVSGSTGVNRLVGGYKLDENKLKFTGMVTTRMAGPEELMKQETAFVNALESADSWKRTGERLELLSGDKVVAVFAPSAQ